jgi:hypothetical protein
MADRPADDSEIGNAGVDAAALQAEIEALRQRLAALESAAGEKRLRRASGAAACDKATAAAKHLAAGRLRK